MGALAFGNQKAAYRYKAFRKTHLPIRITPLGDHELVSSEIFDISTSGVSLLVSPTDAVPKVGQGVKIDLTLMDTARISCIGRIARTQRIGESDLPQVKVGIQFYDLPLRYRLAIKKAIDAAVALEKEYPDLAPKRESAPELVSQPRPTLLYDTPIETTWGDILKIVALFGMLALGVYLMDRYSTELSFLNREDPPAWASKVFKLREMEVARPQK